jgi:hypothetical protein
MSDRLEMLHAGLDQSPYDQGLREVLADYLRETGDPAGADGLMWLVANDRVPFLPNQKEGGGFYQGNPVAIWSNYTTGFAPDHKPDKSELPSVVYAGFKAFTRRPAHPENMPADPKGVDQHETISYPSRREAEEEFLAYWRLLSASAREAFAAPRQRPIG